LGKGKTQKTMTLERGLEEAKVGVFQIRSSELTKGGYARYWGSLFFYKDKITSLVETR